MQGTTDEKAAAAKPKRRRTWLLRIATVLLLVGFATPTCFTHGLWRDDSNRTELAAARSPVVQVFQAAQGEGRIVMHMPLALAQLFLDLPAAAATDPVWLQATPQHHPATVATLLSLAESLAATRDGHFRAPWNSLGPYLQRLDARDGASSEWTIRLDYPISGSALSKLLARQPGVTMEIGFGGATRFATPCTLQVLTSPPTGSPVPVTQFAVVRSRVADEGMPLVGRMLITPLSLLADVVTAPLQLLVWYGQ